MYERFYDCGYGVRIVPLCPPACRKRRLKGGGARQFSGNVRASLDAKVWGSTPARAEVWIDISAPSAPLLRLWDHDIGYQSQSQA